MGETMVNVLMAVAPSAITTSRHPIEQGCMPPSLVGHRRRPGESLLCAGACLGLLLCRDTGFCLLIGVELSPSHAVTVELQGMFLA
jgi:hypothetical protein